MRASPRFRARPSPSADRTPTPGWRTASRADAPRPMRWRLQPEAGPSKAPIAVGGSTPRVSRLGELEPERRFAALGAILAGQTHPDSVAPVSHSARSPSVETSGLRQADFRFSPGGGGPNGQLSPSLDQDRLGRVHLGGHGSPRADRLG